MRKFKKFIALPLLFVFVFCCTLSFAQITPASADSAKQLVAYYKFDADTKDYSGNGNDGTVMGGKLSYDNAIVGKGAKFDGTTYIEVEDSDSLDLSEAFTISLWLYKDTAGPKGYAPILSKGDNTYADENTPYALYHSQDGYCPEVRLINTDGYDYLGSSTKVSLQRWHLLTVTFDSKEVKFYIDGTLKEKKSWGAGPLFKSDQKLLIGCNPTDDAKFFKGTMDDLRMYNYNMSDGEIKALYDATKAAPPSTTGSTGSTTGTAATGAVSSSGLVAYYPFNNTLDDLSGNGNNGTAIGNITYANAMVGPGARFDGASYIEVEDSDSLDLAGNFTISAWLYKETSKTGYAPILSKGDNTYADENTPYALYHSQEGYSPEVRLINPDGYEYLGCNTKVSLQKWHLLTVTFNGKDVKFYIDGILKDKKSWDAGALFSSDQKLLIGCDPIDRSEFYKGIMDDLRIYNRTLADNEIKTLYDTVMKTKDTTGRLVGYYKFDGDLKDYSGYNNNGSAIGNITYATGKVGKGAKFDGSSYIEVKDSDSLDVDKAFTISTWLYKDNAGPKGYAPVVTKGDNTYADENTPYCLYHGADGYAPEIRMINPYGYEYLSSNYNVSMQKWYMLTMTFDGKNVKFYIDGILRATRSWDGGDLFHSEQDMLIGADAADQTKFFKGIIDDLRIYNYALADKDVKALFDYTSKPPVAPVSTNPWAGQKITVTPSKVAVKVGATTKLTVTATPSKGAVQNITDKVVYKSNNTKIVTVNKGVIKGIAKGTTTITVTVGTQVFTITVTVQ